MEDVGLDATRFRGVCDKVFDHYIREAAKKYAPLELATAGGDTWIISFDETKTAILHGVELMRLCASAAFEHGLAYLKPSLTVALGRPKSADGRILNNQTTAVFWVHGT